MHDNKEIVTFDEYINKKKMNKIMTKIVNLCIQYMFLK